jgi:type I restriction enzyme S subunit
MSLPGMNLREQRQIAEYLDRETGKIDNLIAKQEQLVATLIERRQAVIREAVTRGLDREVEYQSDKGSWVGRVPQHWAVVPLKWRARLQTGGTPKGDASFDDEASDFGWIRPDDLNETGNPSNATRFLTAEGAAELRPIRAGASLVCGIGATLGKVGRTSVAVWANQQITSIDSDLNDKFIFYVLSAAKSAIVALSVGNTLPIINNDRLGTLVLPVPPTYEQQEIADYLDKRTTSIDSTIAASRQTMSLLRERRQALISAAVTGKIDVRGL